MTDYYKGGFRTQRYAKRGQDLGRIAGVTFNKTDVDTVIAAANQRRMTPYPLIEGRIGDPTYYAGLTPYSRYRVHLQRFSYFHGPHEANGYALSGDEALKERIRMGLWQSPDHIPVPPHVTVYMTPGVSGALRFVSDAIVLPRTPTDDKMDTVIMPAGTYVSHLAETFRSHGEVTTCQLRKDGQLDVDNLERSINETTRTVLFATVGNPLSVAMEPGIFDNVLEIIHKKMQELGHPIIIIADIIYEDFRRDVSKRIDPIQRALKSGLDVPVIEMHSFSKMLAIPGERVGYTRINWDPSVFPDERSDFFASFEHLYRPTLCPVGGHAQRALGSLFTSIGRHDALEDVLASLAAMITALKQITDLKNPREEHPLITTQQINERLDDLGIPEEYFSHRLIASKIRQIANQTLAGAYSVDITSGKVKELARVLQKAGYVDVIEKDGIVFCKLIKDIRPLDLNAQDGQVIVHNLSLKPEWSKLAEECEIQNESTAYDQHLQNMRRTVFERVDRFVRGLEKMRGDGIYMHPAYYDDAGNIDFGRLNSFYVLWGIEQLRHYSPDVSQAAQLASRCVADGLPIIANIPGELFLPEHMRNDSTSSNRNVALQPEQEMDKMLEIIWGITKGSK